MLRATFLVLTLALLGAAHPAVWPVWEVSNGGRASAAEMTVEVGDFFFCSASQAVGTCETVINDGDTVRWTYTQGTEGHTVTHCGDSCAAPTSAPLFDSGALTTGQTFSFTFETPGSYLYYCEFHPPFMQATVVVQPAQPTPTPAPTPEPETPTPAPTTKPSPTPGATPRATPTPTPSPTPIPLAETEDDDGGATTLWLVVGGAVAAAAAATAGVFVVWRRRAG